MLNRTPLLPLTFAAFTSGHAQLPQGAWQTNDKGTQTVWLLQDGYFTSTSFTKAEFVSAFGGPYEVVGNQLVVHEEFNTTNEHTTTNTMDFKLDESSLTVGSQTFRHSDNGTGALAGVWAIAEHLKDGKLTPVQHTGTRKTLKLLTGSRFQWFAIDPATNSFLGTGGGTYGYSDGQYTEHIEFFSRDPQRVGALLTFNAKLENGRWHHSGKSSKGADMSEVWERVPVK